MALIAVPTCKIIERVSWTPPGGGPAVAALSVQCKNSTGVYLAARYVKGSEANVTLQFAIRDQRFVAASQATWFFLPSTVAPCTRYTATLGASDAFSIPIPVPSSIATLLVVTSFPDIPAVGEGELEVGAFTDEGQVVYS